MAAAKRPRTFMKRGRAERFPARTRADFIEWDVSCGPPIIGEYSGANCGRRIDISIAVPGRSMQLRLSPEEAYELREDIGHAYDEANGI